MTKDNVRGLRRVAAAIACLLVFACCSLALNARPAFAAADTNLALNKTAVADSEEAETVRAELAVDGNKTGSGSRWGSDRDSSGGAHWIYVDLGSESTVNSVKVFWENRKATGFKIQYATGTTAPASTSNDWQDAYTSTDRPATTTSEIPLNPAVTARFIRLYITSFTPANPDDANDTWDTVSIYELEVYGTAGEAPEQDPQQNVARGMSATDNGSEATKFGAAKVVDGDTTGPDSRWASPDDATASAACSTEHWVKIDLGQTRDISTVRLYWEQRKATGYSIQVSSDGANWETAASKNTNPSSKIDDITFAKKEARYVRVLITGHQFNDPDGAINWGTVSLFEVEVYGGEAPAPALNSKEALAEAITVTPPAKGATTLTWNVPESENFDVTYNGTDYEQVIGAADENGDIPIYQPVVDTTVKVSFKVTNKTNKSDYAFREINVTVPGEFDPAEGDNAAPDVLPEIREWKGNTGTFAPGDNARVLYTDPTLKPAATELAADYKDLFGKTFTVAQGAADTATAGDIILVKTTDTTLGLQDEGSLMKIGDKIAVTAETNTGAYWATRTILQALKTGNGSIPQGIARDYPLYKVRGLILDVGRKTFTLDWLKQMTKQMSWFKLNDFHVHLNDNYIPVEEYTEDNINQAYSGFRLESNIKKGGDNKADLTSTDMWYTKADFREFIQQSRDRGINIVPEFDMPAHSLAFTKVRPDLRTPNTLMPANRQRGLDHLNLVEKYDVSLAFALSVWNEYTTGENPVFDTQVIQIGADEFEADGTAYRNFVNDMFEYAEGKGYTPRVWGSLTQIRGDGSVQVSGVNEDTGKRRQINLWNAGWANMKEMYDLGFELINCDDGLYYMVPNATYYNDYLDDNTVYNRAINNIGSTTIPAGDPQMVGGAFAVWNDMCDKLENGISEYDVYDRITNSAGLYGAASWGKGGKNVTDAKATATALGDAPNTNFGYDTEVNDENTVMQLKMDNLDDASGNGNGLEAPKARAKAAGIEDVDFKKALALDGGTSYVELSSGLETAGLGNDLRVKVKRTSASTDEQVLFESPYGAIKAVQVGTGKVGISRENRDYSFNYTLSVNEWVELEFKNEQNITKLYVNGQLVDTLGNNNRNQLKATCMFPAQRIGSTENAFKGYVDDVRLTRNAEFASTMELDNALMKAQAVLASGVEDAELEQFVAQAKQVIDKVNPNAGEIASVKTSIEAKVENAEYEKADYSKLDALLAAIPTDLSLYTSESVAMLDSAKGSIQRDLPKGMQDTVDAYLGTITDAIEGLELKDAADNFATIASVTACTEETTGETSPNGPAANVIDGNEETYWHTKWSNPADTIKPHNLTLALSKATTVNGLVYVPRQGTSDGAKNGRLTKYTIEVSTDGATFTQVANGDLVSDTSPKTISFDAQSSVTHVKLIFNETDGAGSNANQHASAAEVKVRQVESAQDIKTSADALVEQIDGLSEDSYTADSWKALSAAVEAYNDLGGNATDEQLRDARSGLLAAMFGLRPAADSETPEPEPEPEPKPDVDKTALNEKLEEAIKLSQKDYTSETWAVFSDALDAAKAVAAKDSATQDEVNAALKTLTDAMSGLKKAETTPEPEPEPEPKPEDPNKPENPDDGKEDGDKGDQGGDNTQKPGDTNKPGDTQKPGDTTKPDDTKPGTTKPSTTKPGKDDVLPQSGDDQALPIIVAGVVGVAIVVVGATLYIKNRREEASGQIRVAGKRKRS